MNDVRTQIQLIDVIHEYPPADPAGNPLRVLNGVSLEIARGESLAIIGPSGCGKSTLLNLIGGLDKPSSGKIIFAGDDLAAFDERRLAQFRNQRAGFIFQTHHLLPQCTMLENVLLPTLADSRTASRKKPLERARLLLERVGLAERESHRPGQLSGGEHQRAAVVRALINEPELLLADEPTGQLDGENAQRLMALLAELNRETGVTLIVVTHALELARKMKRIYRLASGKIARMD